MPQIIIFDNPMCKRFKVHNAWISPRSWLEVMVRNQIIEVVSMNDPSKYYFR